MQGALPCPTATCATTKELLSIINHIQAICREAQLPDLDLSYCCQTIERVNDTVAKYLAGPAPLPPMPAGLVLVRFTKSFSDRSADLGQRTRITRSYSTGEVAGFSREQAAKLCDELHVAVRVTASEPKMAA